MQTRRLAAAAAGIAMVVFVSGPRGVRADDAPKPPPEIQRITALAGTFDGTATYTAGGRTVQFTLHHVNRVIANGFGLAVHEQAELPELGPYEAENLFGWDAGRRMIHLFSVTTDPNTHDHAGRWQDAKHVTLRYEGVRDGRRMVEVIPFQIVSPDTYRFRSTVTVAGSPPEVFEATMKRVEGLSNR
jgi:hypothetical protein